jgi:F0F1-type ATP synthase delta subunit
VRAMHDKLKTEGREALMPRIAKAFERLSARMNERDIVTLTIADKAHEHGAITEATRAITNTAIDKKDIAVRLDSTLIGGWRLEGREVLVDESYKKHLLAIYTRATRS